MQLVILDRHDIVDFDSGAEDVSERDWRAIPGSLEALARLSGAGYRLVVACNEPGLWEKQYDIETLVSIHHRMQHELHEVGGSVDAVFFCSCPPQDDCDCMMPKPGMLRAIAERLRTSLDGVPVIGSSMTTIEAARAAGARPILVRAGSDYDEEKGGSESDLERYDDLGAAVDTLLAESTHV